MRTASQFDKLALAMAALVAVCTAPFALRYWATGALWMAGLVVGFIVIVFAICGAIIHYGRVPPRAYASGMILGAALILIVVERSGVTGMFWAHPWLIFSFLLLGSRYGFWLTVPAMVTFFAVAVRAADGAELARVLTTLAITWTTAATLTMYVDRQRRRLDEVINEDALTGVGNRRAFKDTLLRAVEEYHGLRQPASLMMLDIDHFKRINDQLGHDAGDQTLLALTQRLAQHVPGSSDVFRVGGEELAVVLRGFDSHDGFDAGRRLIETLRTTVVSPMGELTVSAGIATLEPDETSEQWLRRADEALYQAKDQGRDRMCAAAASGGDTRQEFAFVFGPDGQPARA